VPLTHSYHLKVARSTANLAPLAPGFVVGAPFVQIKVPVCALQSFAPNKFTIKKIDKKSNLIF
jgi:hypothetical protein